MKFLSVLLYILLLSLQSSAQILSAQQAEQDLQEIYKQIEADRFGDSINWDKLEIDNRMFREKILHYTSTLPATLTYPFDSLKKINVHIATSSDNLLRIYSWDTWTGGTMVDFANIFQFRNERGVQSKLIYYSSGEDIYVPFYSEIFSLLVNARTYYLAINHGIYTSKEASQSLKIFTMDNNNLIDTVKLIKTEKGLANSIDIYFDFFSVASRPERPVKLIRYDSIKKTIYVPIIGDREKVTDKFIAYQFNGHDFEPVGIRSTKQVFRAMKE